MMQLPEAMSVSSCSFLTASDSGRKAVLHHPRNRGRKTSVSSGRVSHPGLTDGVGDQASKRQVPAMSCACTEGVRVSRCFERSAQCSAQLLKSAPSSSPSSLSPRSYWIIDASTNVIIFRLLLARSGRKSKPHFRFRVSQRATEALENSRRNYHDPEVAKCNHKTCTGQCTGISPT